MTVSPKSPLGKGFAYAVLPSTMYQFMNAKTMAITVPAILPTNPMSCLLVSLRFQRRKSSNEFSPKPQM